MIVEIVGKTEIDLKHIGDLCRTTHYKNPYLADTVDYLHLLKQFTNPKITRQLMMENPGHLLRHIQYTFGVVCNYEIVIKLLQTTTLDIEYVLLEEQECLAIISGNLEDYRNVMLNDVEKTRPVLNRIMLLLEYEGYQKLWLGYRKQKTPNETFKLICS